MHMRTTHGARHGTPANPGEAARPKKEIVVRGAFVASIKARTRRIRQSRVGKHIGNGRDEVAGSPARGLHALRHRLTSLDGASFRGLVLGCIEAKVCK